MGSISHTVSGDIASFKSAARVPITSLKCHFKPQQDLHGYSNPWPAGGGKNLFNVNASEQDPSDTSVQNTTVRVFTPGTFTSCAAWSNWRDPSRIYAHSVTNNVLSVTSTTGYGVGYAMAVDGSTQYAVSCTITGYGDVNVAYYDASGNYLSGESTSSNINNTVITTPSGAVIAVLIFRGNTSVDAVTFSNIQFEKSSSVTTYAPYSNVCPITGWTGLTGYTAGSNLFDSSSAILTNLSLSNGIYQNTIIDTRNAFNAVVQLWSSTSSFIKNVGSLAISDTGSKSITFNVDDSQCHYLTFRHNGSQKNFDVRFPFDLPLGTYTISFDVLSSDPTTEGGVKFKNLALCAGSSPCEYGPYQKQTIPVTFPVLGKNKFDYANADIVNQKRLDDNGNEVSDSLASYCKLLIPVLPNTEYTISGYAKNNTSKRIYFIDRDETFISRSSTFGGTYYTFDTPDNCYYIQIQNREVANASWDTVQLELGDTATTYEEYSSNNTVYGGYVDIAAGEVVAEYKIETLDDPDNITEGSYSGYCTYSYPAMGLDRDRSSNLNVVSSIAPTSKTNGVANSFFVRWQNKIGNMLQFWDSTLNTKLSDIKQLISDGLITICYPIATPIHYPISKTELTALLGPNNAWSNANDITDISYAIHDSAPIRAAKRRIAINEPHIATATGNIANFSTDLASPLKSCKLGFSPVQDLHGYSNPWPAGGGKNLFDESSITYGIWTDSSGNVTQADRGCRTNDIAVTSGDTYTAMYKGDQPYSASIVELDANKDFISRNHMSWSGVSSPTALTVTLGANTKYIYLQVFRPEIDSTMTPSILSTYKMQLEKGSSSTSYSPYSNICPISGWTGLDLYHTRKNLLSPDIRANYGSQLEVQLWGCAYSATSPHPPNGDLYLKAGNYVISIDTEGKPTEWRMWDNDGATVFHSYSRQNQYISFTLQKDTAVSLYMSMSRTYVDDLNYKVQIECGSARTTFESYSGTTPISIDWTTGVGTVYGGYLDLINGEIVATHEYKEYDGSSDENWALSGTNDFVCKEANARIDARGLIPLCDKFQMEQTYTAAYPIRPANSKICGSDVNEWRTWLGNNPIHVVYELITPIHYTLTSQQLKSLKGTNNIWSDANGQIEVKYWKH